MSATDLLAVLTIVVAAPLCWLVVILLRRMARAAPDIRVLRAHYVASLGLALIVSVFALVFLNNDLDEPIIDFDATKFATRGTLLFGSLVAALYWLRIYWRASGSTDALPSEPSEAEGRKSDDL